eukprot:CAMPEP_0171154884 /NCGR_PEP_ID=MMETSP0790-20130122/581_1 /TAXON_ID=2925 /ORGANISM="Alexandrium catenella, Strain OF101" /LENGTH=34 /DNA_ID= /DNA_START= /DNA_END= /DNA_ORIENTATION=
MQSEGGVQGLQRTVQLALQSLQLHSRGVQRDSGD